ncbi:MAG: hypothetical protein AAF915_19880 [Cyanobacteria bacterium P01_D01_bin.50]
MAHYVGGTIDEINHIRKLWRFSVWAYPDTFAIKINGGLVKTRYPKYTRNSLIKTLNRMIQILKWISWNFSNKSSLLFTITSAIHQLKIWNNALSKEYFNELFGERGIPNSKLPALNA